MRRNALMFVAVLTSLMAGVYSYLAWRLTDSTELRIVLALPFLAIWLVPLLYWIGSREGKGLADRALHFVAYLSMGWVSFVLVLSVLRDLLQALSASVGLSTAADFLAASGSLGVTALSLVALALGAVRAAQGPKICHVEVKVADLHPDLEGFRMVQISDLHVSALIRRPYVERVVRLANELKPDLVAITGDLIDGQVKDLTFHVEPLAALLPKGQSYFITGNHEYYSDGPAWVAHCKKLGMNVLENSHLVVNHRGAKMLVAGVLDPAARMVDGKSGPDPEQAALGAGDVDFRLLLAHNPKIAPRAAPCGYDLQLSGHTHGGQFYPWTFVTKLVHAPHFAGLSREGKMWVYVSAGTGTWGPPIRLGTEPEITLIRLVRG